MDWLKYMDWLKKLANIEFEAFFCLAFGVVVVVRAFFFIYNRNRILEHGLIAVGKIISIKYRFSNKLFSKSPVIRFTTVDGKIVESVYSVTTIFTSYHKGMQVTVMYDSYKPDNFIIKEESDSKMSALLFLLWDLY